MAKQHRTGTDYCLKEIKQRLTEKDMLERESIEVPIKPSRDANLIADLRKLTEAVKTERDGRLIDVDLILDQVREQRDQELSVDALTSV